MAVGNKSLSPEAMEALKRYPWPGNVRELENTLKSLMITNVSNFISLDSFPGHLMKKGNPCLLYTSPSPRDRTRSRMPSSA